MFSERRWSMYGVRPILAALLLACGFPSARASLAESTVPKPALPRAQVEIPSSLPAGKILSVRAGENFQDALNRARPGDVIELEAGATFKGPFTLPRREGRDWILIRSSAAEGALPPTGTRVQPSHAAQMPKLEASSGPVISASSGAHHYRFIGLEIRPSRGTFLHNLVLLGSSETSIDEIPHHIIFERCYLHGDPKMGTRRGIAMNSAHTAVVDSYLSDFKEAGADSQAILGWNGPGPFKIANNYLEAAGENVMFGGGDPAIPDLVPSDIEIRGNHLSKPLSWKIGHRAYEGTPWTVKNLFELKNARRVLIEENLLERNWAHAQNGFAVLFTVRNQDGGAPWSVVEDVVFRNNVVRHTASGINILGRDDNHPSQQTKRILIEGNLFQDAGGSAWGGGGTLFQLLNGTQHVVIEHNTAVQTGQIVMADGEAHRGFVYRNNVALHNEYGIIGTGTPPGAQTLAKYFPGALVEGNVIVGGNPSYYPKKNFFPASLRDVGFLDPASGKYPLADSSGYRRRAAGGRDPGADFQRLSVAAGAAAGRAHRGRREAERQE